MPGIDGTVADIDEQPAALGEYWHRITTEHGEQNEPDCNLELVPEPAGKPLANTAPAKRAMPSEFALRGAAGLGARIAGQSKAKAHSPEWGLVHAKVRAVAESRFSSGHFADSVEAAMKAVNEKVREIVKRETGEEWDGANLMFKAFSPDHPILKIGDNTNSGKDMQRGYQQIFAGAMTGIRNPKAHGNITIDPVRAIHLIYLASLLMSQIDAATVNHGGDPRRHRLARQ